MHTRFRRTIARSLAVVLAVTLSCLAGDTVTWKPLSEAMLRIDDRAPKQWNLFHTGKKYDPLLLQLGTRDLVIYVREQAVYEVAPANLHRKGESLVWKESDKPQSALATADWSSRDIGYAWRLRITLTAEGRTIDIQIPESVDFRGY